jgi:heterodisulfide reductase subunit B
MKISLFTGCVVPIRYPGMEVATRFLAEKLDIDLVDVKFGCCPSPSGLKEVHFDAWLALAARNLCLTEGKGLDVMTLCAGCTNTLRETNQILAEDERKRLFVHDILERHGKTFKGTMQIYHLADVLARDEYLDRLEAACLRPLGGLKIGTHYGCHYFRPSSLMHDGETEPDPRYPLPETMELILEALGAEIVPYNRQDFCCGAALSINTGMSDESLAITSEKLGWMQEAGLHALAVTCPTCFNQFDSGQVLLRRRDKSMSTFPVFHIAELVAWALGCDAEQLNLRVHRIPVSLPASYSRETT